MRAQRQFVCSCGRAVFPSTGRGPAVAQDAQWFNTEIKTQDPYPYQYFVWGAVVDLPFGTLRTRKTEPLHLVVVNRRALASIVQDTSALNLGRYWTGARVAPFKSPARSHDAPAGASLSNAHKRRNGLRPWQRHRPGYAPRKLLPQDTFHAVSHTAQWPMHLTGTPITFRAIHGLVWAAFKPHQPSDLRPQTVYPFSSKRYDDQRPQHAGSLQNTLPHRLHPPRRRELRQRRRGVWDDPAQRVGRPYMLLAAAAEAGCPFRNQPDVLAKYNYRVARCGSAGDTFCRNNCLKCDGSGRLVKKDGFDRYQGCPACLNNCVCERV
ncbi:hypothetical protein AcV5_009658 [Taiwanofungus camphoratus]|nr:hypothetical protein AcV5_009658 [Antrodia cinnamomea]